MRVSQETCKLAVEKGYSKCTCIPGYPSCICKGECWFIEQHELQEWLRATYKIDIYLEPMKDKSYRVWVVSKGIKEELSDWMDYNKGIEEALEYSLSLI